MPVADVIEWDKSYTLEHAGVYSNTCDCMNG